MVPGLLTLHPAAFAEESSSWLEPVEVRGTAAAAAAEFSVVDREATRPRSVLTPQAIQEFAPKLADFGTLANLLPSFVSSAPNGNAFDAAKSMTLRGFPDGQFNVTLDGIPFADPDTFGHHSTSLFPASSISQLNVDRSPGSGSSLGHSGTGGTLNISSLAIPNAPGIEMSGAYGSFATQQLGLRMNTAAPNGDGQTGVLMNLQHLQSDGAMANAFGRRDDVLLKSESWVAGSRLALLYSYDNYHFFNPPSVTTDQLATQGSSVGFSRNPASPDYNEYAKTDRTADIGYARLQLPVLGDTTVTDTVYTYSYRNRGLSSNGDITLPKSYQVGSGFGVPATDIAGRLSTTSYRTIGNILQIERAESFGALRTGLWLEHNHLEADRNAIDLSSRTLYNANTAAASPVLFDYRSTLETIAPYVDQEWKATPSLLVRGGLRYQQVSRSFDASVVPTSRPATNGPLTRDAHSLLPSLEGNYALTDSTHVYAQWAKGALVPSQSFFYTSKPALGNQAAPQTSQAVQGGIVYAAGPFGVAIDGYQINLHDYVSQVTDAAKNTVFINNGNVRYRGLEIEGHGELGRGLGAVFNGSVTRARFGEDAMATSTQKAGDTIPLVPSYTGLLGLLYQRGPWSGSVLAKFIGTEYQGPGGSADGNDRRVDPYHYVNLTLNRSLGSVAGMSQLVVSLQVANLENRTPRTDSAGRAAVGAGGPLLVNVLARRSYLLQVRGDL